MRAVNLKYVGINLSVIIEEKIYSNQCAMCYISILSTVSEIENRTFTPYNCRLIHTRVIQYIVACLFFIQ